MTARKVSTLGLAIALCVSMGCRPQPPETPTTEAPPAFPSSPSDGAEDGAEPTPLPENAQIYQDENGMFALALPPDYTFEAIASGMTFTSPDGGFGGTIQYQTLEDSSAQSKDLTQPELETRLKDQIEAQFADVSWESELEEQADGSLRLEWKGTSPSGGELDGLSFIEQHGSVIFILTAQGIDRPYQDYNQDAQIIVGTYVVRENDPTVTQAEGAE